MKEWQILMLNQQDVINTGLLEDMTGVLEKVETVFRLHGMEQVENPPKTMITLNDPEMGDWMSKFIAMPVYIGGKINRPGIKWAAESMTNARTRELPMGIDMVILSDPVTVEPKAIIEGTLITAMRTAAATGIAAKYLARKNSEIVGCIGAGVIGRTVIQALVEVFPGIRKVKLFDIYTEKAEKIAEEFQGRVNVEIANSLQETVSESDIIATMTTSTKPLVKKEWLKEGYLITQLGANEVEARIVTDSDMIVVDDWEPIKHNHLSVFYPLIKEGKIKDDHIKLLRHIVCGKIPARISEGQNILYSSRGMGCLDIIVADHIYKTAIEKGLGYNFKMWDKPYWI